MKTEIIPADHPTVIQHAVDVLNNGGLVAFPTDTVYGVAASIHNDESIERLYFVKGRMSTKAIAVLISRTSELSIVAQNFSNTAVVFADEFWPGPLTIVLEKHPDIPEVISPLPTIGVRIPDHPVALSLLEAAGPLAVTSANLSGQPSAQSAADVMTQLENRIHLIIDGGNSPGGVPSTVVDCTSSELKILRDGPISFEQLQSSLNK